MVTHDKADETATSSQNKTLFLISMKFLPFSSCFCPVKASMDSENLQSLHEIKW